MKAIVNECNDDSNKLLRYDTTIQNNRAQEILLGDTSFE